MGVPFLFIDVREARHFAAFDSHSVDAAPQYAPKNQPIQGRRAAIAMLQDNQ
jgi:hypothetical protein